MIYQSGALIVISFKRRSRTCAMLLTTACDDALVGTPPFSSGNKVLVYDPNSIGLPYLEDRQDQGHSDLF